MLGLGFLTIFAFGCVNNTCNANNGFGTLPAYPHNAKSPLIARGSWEKSLWLDVILVLWQKQKCTMNWSGHSAVSAQFDILMVTHLRFHQENFPL
jgi:hypothetical protein